MADATNSNLLSLFSAVVSIVALLVAVASVVYLARGDWRTAVSYLGPHKKNFRPLIQKMISEAERQFGVSLTWAAREMLVIPVQESLEYGRPLEFESIRESIFMLVSATAEPFPTKEDYYRNANSAAIVRAFYSRFCKIPPFCDGRGR